MTEEKRQGKKWGIIRQIFRWIWRGLLAALIIGAIIFDAPWKVLALLLIFFAACTILPRPARKWFWLSVATVVIALIIWILLPDKDGGWRPYTFDKELAALKAKYEIPDSENAALLYNRLFEDPNVDSDSNRPEFFAKSRPSSMSEPWLSKGHPETAEWLKSQQKTIDTLMEISKIEKCRFPIVADLATFSKHMPPLSKIRGCAQLLISAANNDIAEGRTDAALEKYLCVNQMAKHLYQQPEQIDFLVGSAVEGLALAKLNRFMIEGQPDSEQFQLITNSIKELENNWNWGSDFRKWLDVEKLFCKNFLSIFYEINKEGRTRLTRNPVAATESLSQQNCPQLSYLQKKIIKSHTILGWFFMPATPQDVAKTTDAAYEKNYAMADPGFDWSKKPPMVQPRYKLNYTYMVNLLANMAGQSYYRIHETYIRQITVRRGFLLVAAVSRYKIENNAWPKSLEEIKPLTQQQEVLIDPMNNGSFVYKLTEDGFTLYSKGLNNIDEDGNRDEPADDWPIWPTTIKQKSESKTQDAE